MTEKELIAKIKILKRIEPQRDWVVLTKERILGETPSFSEKILVNLREVFQPRFALVRPVFATVLTAVFVLIGVFGFSQGSLPGDFLYPVKKISESAKINLVAERERPKVQLELTEKRLEELNRVVKNNQVKNLSLTLNEFEKSKSVTKKEVSRYLKNKSVEEAIKIAKEVAPRIQEINNKEKEVLAVLGLEPEPGKEPAEKTIVELLVKDLENKTLSGEQAELFQKVKEEFQNGNYNLALELILKIENR